MKFLFLLLTTVCAVESAVLPLVLHEDFASNPMTRWKSVGETNLFQWNSAAEVMEIVWDSSITNSYFYLPLGLNLSREDDFKVEFALRLKDIQIGVNPLKPYTFEIAVGLINSTNAFDPATIRGSGVDLVHGTKNVLEFDYFADSGFGATIAPTLITAQNQIAYSHNYPLELIPDTVYRVEMLFTSTNGTLTTSLTANGNAFGLPPDNTIEPIILTSRFTNIVLNAFAVSSYSDAGQNPPQFSGSVLAHGSLDDVKITIYHRPLLQVAFLEGRLHLYFESEADWNYLIETSPDLLRWTKEPEVKDGTGEQLDYAITDAPSPAYYRISAVRK
jgi:hypothetical protein